MSELKFNKDTLSVINIMSKVNQKVLFDKEGEKLVIRCKSPDSLVAYRLEAPKEHFGFAGDNVAFYNYPEFYSLVDNFETPTLDENESTITIKKNNTKVSYRVSDPEIVKTSTFKKININADYKVELPSIMVASIKKFISILKAEKVRISFTNDSADVKIYNEYGADAVETLKASLVEGKASKNFSVIIHANTFDYLPGGDYVLGVDSNGLLEFEYLYSDDLTLKLYSSEIEEA